MNKKMDPKNLIKTQNQNYAMIQLFYFIHGLRDSLKIVSSFKRYYFSTLEVSSQQIHDVLKELVSKLIFYFILSICVYSVLDYFLPQIVVYFSIFYYLLYLIPLYVAILVYVVFWYGDLSVAAINIEIKQFENYEFIKYKREIEKTNDVAEHGANALKKMIFMISYILNGIIISQISRMIPFFGPLIFITLYSIYYALFLFMLKWSYNNYVLCYFEMHLGYFAGFGFIFSTVSHIFSYSIQDGVSLFLLSDGIYYLLFTIFFFVSINSRPPLLPLEKLSFKNMFKFEQIQSNNTQVQNTVQKVQQDNDVIEKTVTSKKYNNNTSFVQFMRLLSTEREFKSYCKKKKQGFFILTRYLTSVCNTLLGNYIKRKQ